jgi:predicted DNA-binding transcriptional regulator YafY
MEKEHPPLQHFINKTAGLRQLEKVVIDVEKEVVKYFGEQKYYNGFVKEEEAGDSIRMTFLCGSLEGFARWFMLFGERAVIIEPVSLNDRILGLLKRLEKKINYSATLLT